MNKLTKLVSVIVVTRNRKKELIKCLQSLQASDYRRIEIVVVDNDTTPPVSSWLKNKFKGVELVRSAKNLGAAGGRNLGLKFARGDFLLFMDDDASADKKMISQLVAVLKNSPQAGIAQPKIYDMQSFSTDGNILQGIGCDISLLTGRVSALGIREEDTGQYDHIKEISTVGCVWMVKAEVIKKVGGYDENYFIPYEDLDFSFRARKSGFKIYFAPKALAWHNSIKSTFVNSALDYIGIRSADQAYRIARNKIIFMRKYSPFPNLLIFLFILLPFYTLVHSIIILSSLKFSLLSDYWKGVISGLIYLIRISL